MKPHKWAKEIKAWADGVEIEYKGTYEDESGWEDDENPDWFCETYEFRIKPQPKEPQYLYVFSHTDGNDVRLSTNPLRAFKNEEIIAKIKLENDDASNI